MDTHSAEERHWVTGLFSVQAVVEGGVRPVYRLLVQDDRLDGPTARLQRLARERGIPVERVPAPAISGTTGNDQHHGLAAEVGPRQFLTIPELLDEPGPAAVFMLDGIEDPYNLGQGIRSLYAAGATGLILPQRNWLSATEIVLRASAGAADRLPVALAGSAPEVLEACRSRGLVVIVATEDDAQPLYAVDLRSPFVVVIGGEKRGISRSLLSEADVRLTIPYGRPFDGALGSAAAAAVIGFEALRQRQ